MHETQRRARLSFIYEFRFICSSEGAHLSPRRRERWRLLAKAAADQYFTDVERISWICCCVFRETSGVVRVRSYQSVRLVTLHLDLITRLLLLLLLLGIGVSFGATGRII